LPFVLRFSKDERLAQGRPVEPLKYTKDDGIRTGSHLIGFKQGFLGIQVLEFSNQFFVVAAFFIGLDIGLGIPCGDRNPFVFIVQRLKEMDETNSLVPFMS
jgi:hypothetical protein